jgi:son of sevenless-like protein
VAQSLTLTFRVLNVLKTWIEQHLDMDNEEDVKALDELKRFCNAELAETLPKASDRLLRIIHKKRARIENTLLQSACPSPILPKTMDRIRFLELDPLELARQLTLMHARAFKKIKAEEFLFKMWVTPKARHRNIRNVNRLTDQV